MMVSKLRSSLVMRPLAAAGVLALLTACGGQSGEAEGSGEAASPSSSSAAPSSEAPELASTEELSAALLPAEAFGSDADVVKISVDEISKATTGGLPPGVTVQPESCAQLAGAAQLPRRTSARSSPGPPPPRRRSPFRCSPRASRSTARCPGSTT